MPLDPAPAAFLCRCRRKKYTSAITNSAPPATPTVIPATALDPNWFFVTGGTGLVVDEEEVPLIEVCADDAEEVDAGRRLEEWVLVEGAEEWVLEDEEAVADEDEREE